MRFSVIDWFKLVNVRIDSEDKKGEGLKKKKRKRKKGEGLQKRMNKREDSNVLKLTLETLMITKKKPKFIKKKKF